MGAPVLLYLTLAERIVALWKSIFSRKPKDGQGPTATAPVTTPEAPPAPSYYRPRPKALLGLTAAWLALWWLAGCATTDAFTAKTLPELAKLCEQVVPCEPCPPEPPIPPIPLTGGDAIDPASVTWLHASPAAFRVTAILSDVRLHERDLSWEWQHPAWPEWQSGKDEPYVVGNLWVIGQVGGKWYGATLEWLRNYTMRTELQGGAAAPIFIQCKREPISTWRPKKGERVCWMASTITRAGIQPADSPRERSPIVCGVMP